MKELPPGYEHRYDWVGRIGHLAGMYGILVVTISVATLVLVSLNAPLRTPVTGTDVWLMLATCRKYDAVDVELKLLPAALVEVATQ